MEAIVVAKTAGISIGGASVVGATGYGAYTLIKPTNIEEQLKWNSKDVLPIDDSSRDADWTTLVKDYESENSADNKISGLNLTAPSDNSQDRAGNISKLKEKCKELLKTKLSDDSDESKYKKAERWCCAKTAVAEAN